MPNIPPKKPSRQVPSGERLKQMLTGSMTEAMPGNVQTGAPLASFQQAVMQNSPYNPSDYTPEELAQYNRFRYDPSNTLGGYPIERDPQYFTPGSEKYAIADSAYTAKRLEDEIRAARAKELKQFFNKLGMRR